MEKEVSCPFRCKDPRFKHSRFIKNLLSNIKLKCQNGCNQEIPYLEIENHYEENCPNIKIDYKKKYFELKNKYLDIIKKNYELENQFISYKHVNINYINNNFKSIYHSHILVENTYSESNWTCDICNNYYKAKTEKGFRCNNCDFDICIKCRILEDSGYKFNNVFLSKTHKHLLKEKISSSSSPEPHWICDICNNKFSSKEVIKRFRCEKCDYDICDNCRIHEDNNINQLNNQMDNMHIED